MGQPQSWNRYTYVLNNPLRLVDPTGLESQDPKEEQKKKPEPEPTPTPAKIVITIGDQKTYNGEPRVFPDGASNKDEKLYGLARINTIHVQDKDGNPIDPESGVTIEENVELESATPEDAAKIRTTNSNGKRLPLEEGGVRYDTVGLLSPDPNTLKNLEALPPFTRVDKQTLTVRTADGNAVLQMVNKVTTTKSGSTYTPGEVVQLKKP